MPPTTLSVLDTTGIQDYIFGSNRLREQVGASYLVEQSTQAWLEEALDAMRFQGEANAVPTVVYRGGGNVLLCSSSLKVAQAFVGAITRRLVRDAPGLDIVAAHYEFDWDTEAIGGPDGAYTRLMDRLELRKQQRRTAATLPGQSVTLVCHSSGLPAVAVDLEGDSRPISAEIDAKVQQSVRRNADARLRVLLDLPELDRYALSRDFDDLGRTRGESSYIAVVHADGNGIGRRFGALLNRFDTPGNGNQTCLDMISALSASINDAATKALQRTVQRMLEAFGAQHFDTFTNGLPHDTSEDGTARVILPFRPLVFGGDDVTFVCDGRLGLALAAAYLEEFAAAATQLADGKPAFACAGVAIVKAHYPFARAYKLSNALCTSAKWRVRQAVQEGLLAEDGAALDWHIAQAGVMAELKDLRARDYVVLKTKGELTMRPLLMEGQGWRTWPAFVSVANALRYGEDWVDRRNKVIGLREALRGERSATEQFRVAYGVRALPEIAGATDQLYRQQGWIGDRCVYFDAVEALDFYLPLQEPKLDQG